MERTDEPAAAAAEEDAAATDAMAASGEDGRRALSPEEVRVLGALAEKQMTTPQYYPLTLNALVSACNQSSNRSPVVRYDESTVQAALDSLRAKGLSRIVHSVHNRAIKFRHVVDEQLYLDERELAVVAVLLLRGAQTPGELRARTERMAPFADVRELEQVLEGLSSRAVPLVTRLERQPGQKEARYAHLLSGPHDPDDRPAVRAEVRAPAPSRDTDLDQLREAMSELQAEMEAMKSEVARLTRLVDP